MSANGSYHHGDLRNALILSAAELIAEGGSAAFSLADAARRAGVSSAAPYRHFRDREDLLDAVAELCFLGLASAAEATRSAHSRGSREAVLALGETYLRFTFEHQAFYNLMWGRDKAAEDCEQVERERPGFFTFVTAVSDWCDANGVTGNDPLDTSIKLWGLAHGLAVLSMNGQIDTMMPGADPFAMLRDSAGTFLDGLATH